VVEGLWLWTAGGRLVIDGSYVAPATGCMRRMRCPSAREDDVLVGPPRRTERRFPRAPASLASGADALSSPIVCIVCGRRTYILYVCVYICGHDSLQRLGRNEAEMGANRAVRADALAGHSRRRNRAAGGRMGWMGCERGAASARGLAGSCASRRWAIAVHWNPHTQVSTSTSARHAACIMGCLSTAPRRKCPSSTHRRGIVRQQCIEEGTPVSTHRRGNVRRQRIEEELSVLRIGEGISVPTHRRGNVRINASKRKCPPSTHRKGTSAFNASGGIYPPSRSPTPGEGAESIDAPIAAGRQIVRSHNSNTSLNGGAVGAGEQCWVVCSSACGRCLARDRPVRPPAGGYLSSVRLDLWFGRDGASAQPWYSARACQAAGRAPP